MDDWSVAALKMRETINIAIVALSLTLCVLFGRYIAQEWWRTSYRALDWPVKLGIGLSFVFAGELLRSVTVWAIIHYDPPGTYLSDFVVLIVSLVLITTGALCVIRVMSPARCGHKLWVGVLLVIIALAATNYFLR